MPLSDEPSFTVPDTVLTREVGDELVMLDLRTERYYGLNSVAARIVTLLTTSSRDRALARLLEDYEVDSDVFRRDADQLVAEMLAAGLLTTRDPAS